MDELGRYQAMINYVLFNPSTGEIRTQQMMFPGLADDLNQMYRENEEDWRWVPAPSELNEN